MLQSVEQMQRVIELARAVRERHTRPVKTPLRELVVVHPDESFLADIAGAVSATAKSHPAWTCSLTQGQPPHPGRFLCGALRYQGAAKCLSPRPGEGSALDCAPRWMYAVYSSTLSLLHGCCMRTVEMAGCSRRR